MKPQRTNDLVLTDAGTSVPAGERQQVLPLDEIATLGLHRVLRCHGLRYRDVSILTPRLELMRKPFNKAVLLRLMARRRCWMADEQGALRRINLVNLLLLAARRLRDELLGRIGVRRFLRKLASLESAQRPSPARFGRGPAIYLRADLVFGIKSGGSVGHIAGVLNQLRALLGAVRFFATECIPTVDRDIEPVLIRPGQRYADLPETRSLLFSEDMAQRVMDELQDQAPRFIYQRYAVNNITGVLLAHHYRVPLVIEYNGSEVWINRHWGKALADEDLALRLERLNLERADLVVVVSQPLADQLIQMGIDPRRILVNPNGVDTDRYRPGIACEHLRMELGLQRCLVVGFIGTFGPWHGAEVFAEAAARLLDDAPQWRGKVRFLFIGDGQTMPRVKNIVEQQQIAQHCVFTGLVPQEQGPGLMAVCDILVSPHVPNPDGTPFFGSPTKLFEYLAMGKPVVASALDQITELLSDDDNAVLVSPGQSAALAAAIEALLDDPARRRRLGEAARETALSEHTWRRHTQRILDALDGLIR